MECIRKQIGEECKKARENNKISKTFVRNNGIRFELINSIEEGKSAYTIDSLIKYTQVVDIPFASKKQIAAYFRSVRLKNGESIYKMSLKCNISVLAYKAIEEGKSAYTIDTLIKALKSIEQDKFLHYLFCW